MKSNLYQLYLNSEQLALVEHYLIAHGIKDAILSEANGKITKGAREHRVGLINSVVEKIEEARRG